MLQAGPNVCLYSPSRRDGHIPDNAGRRAPRPRPEPPYLPIRKRTGVGRRAGGRRACASRPTPAAERV